jgi:signal transduction histidine kinase
MRWLYFAFLLAIGSFAASSVYTQFRMAEVDQAAYDIAENAAPSIEHLAAARAQLQIIALELSDYVDQAEAGSRPSDARIRAAKATLDQQIADYLSLPVFAGEVVLWDDVRRGLTRLDGATERTLDAVAAKSYPAAEHILSTEVRKAVDEASASILRSVDFDARHAHDLAIGIKTVRVRVMKIAFVLDAVSAILTVTAGVLAARALRKHSELADAHSSLLGQRAEELEQFAGRVAHDVLSPLAAVTLGLRMAEAPDPDKRSRALGRAQQSVLRVQKIVDGLLEFARAGARPEEGAFADVREVFEDLESELGPAARSANVELTIDPVSSCFVGCSVGVLTSLISNLARNAIKYMGESTVRTVKVRATERAASVRIEVEDTGPGIPPGMEAAVFEPYVRARGTMQPGIGLGLATVKRMASAHGGGSGVRSETGRGCLFWFELPRVEPRASQDRVTGSVRAS